MDLPAAAPVALRLFTVVGVALEVSWTLLSAQAAGTLVTILALGVAAVVAHLLEVLALVEVLTVAATRASAPTRFAARESLLLLLYRGGLFFLGLRLSFTFLNSLLLDLLLWLLLLDWSRSWWSRRALLLNGLNRLRRSLRSDWLRSRHLWLNGLWFFSFRGQHRHVVVRFASLSRCRCDEFLRSSLRLRRCGLRTCRLWRGRLRGPRLNRRALRRRWRVARQRLGWDRVTLLLGAHHFKAALLTFNRSKRQAELVLLIFCGGRTCLGRVVVVRFVGMRRVMVGVLYMPVGVVHSRCLQFVSRLVVMVVRLRACGICKLRRSQQGRCAQ